MAQFVLVPVERLDSDTLTALLEEYASRDGTDYGLREVPLSEKVASLRAQLRSGDLGLVYEQECEQWDLLPREALAQLEL